MDRKTHRRNLWMFPLGTVGRDALYQLYTNYLLTFVLFTRKLNAAQLMAITGIMVAARIFDALNDPIMGNIIDRTRTRWGKFKPWMAIGILTTSIVVYFAFNTTLEGWSFIVFFGIIYFLYSITYTMHDISYWGMVPSLGSNADARNQYTSRATLFAGIGGTLASILIPLLTTGELTIGGSAAIAYGRIALVICILSPLFLCFTLFGAREDRSYEKETPPPVSFKKILSTIANNDQLRWIGIIFLLQEIGNGIVVGGIGSTYIYFVYGYSGGLYSTFTTIGMAATAFLMVFYPAISRRIHRKPLMDIMMLLATAGYVLMLAAGLFLAGSTVGFVVMTTGYMFANFGQYCFYLVMMISILNTVEYNEYKTGVRDDAIIGSLRPFLTKLASALIVVITSATYLVFGVTECTNQISSLEQQTSLGTITEAEKLASIGDVLAGVRSGQAAGLLVCMTLLPWLFMLASWWLYRRRYKLDEAEYDRICAELAAGKAGNAE